MAANMTDRRGEETTGIGAPTRRGRGGEKRFGFYGAIAAALIAVLIVGVALHDRSTSRPAAPALTPAVVTRTQQQFLENNTTNLPNMVTADVRPVITSQQQKFLDVNAAWLPAGADAAPSAMTSSQRRLLEVNTTMLPTTVDGLATTSEQRTSYRVSASDYYVPVSGGMWEVLHVQPGGLAVIEDYVSGPPPVNGIAIST